MTCPKKSACTWTTNQANFVFGLVDLYRIPPDRIDLSRHTTIPEKVKAARLYIRGLVPPQ